MTNKIKKKLPVLSVGWFFKSSFLSLRFLVMSICWMQQRLCINWEQRRPAIGGVGRDSHMKGAAMLVVSLRGVNFGVWSHLGCSGQNAIIFSREVLV